LRIGTIPNNGRSYIDVRNPAWTSLVPGNNYPVELRFDNGAYEQWSGIVERMTDGSPVLSLQTNNSNVIGLVGSATTLDIRYQGHVVMYGQLAGSAQAASSVIQCQSAYTAPDPFRPAGPARQADPFKRV
jgi:hypothetical protein